MPHCQPQRVCRPGGRPHSPAIPGSQDAVTQWDPVQDRNRDRTESGNFAVSRDVQIDTVRFKTFLTAGMLGTVLCNAVPNPSVESDTYTRSIREFGGNRVNPMAYSDTTAGFQSYLTDCGVKTVSARELILPNHPDIAARLGFHDFLPPRSWWPRGAALALLTQRIEFKTNSLVRVRNWWRPTAYNSDPAVGGQKPGITRRPAPSISITERSRSACRQNSFFGHSKAVFVAAAIAWVRCPDYACRDRLAERPS